MYARYAVMSTILNRVIPTMALIRGQNGKMFLMIGYARCAVLQRTTSTKRNNGSTIFKNNGYTGKEEGKVWTNMFAPCAVIFMTRSKEIWIAV